jgi:hypothetical protein
MDLKHLSRFQKKNSRSADVLRKAGNHQSNTLYNMQSAVIGQAQKADKIP